MDIDSQSTITYTLPDKPPCSYNVPVAFSLDLNKLDETDISGEPPAVQINYAGFTGTDDDFKNLKTNISNLTELPKVETSKFGYNGYVYDCSSLNKPICENQFGKEQSIVSSLLDSSTDANKYIKMKQQLEHLNTIYLICQYQTHIIYMFK